MSVLFVLGLLFKNNGTADVGYGIGFIVVSLSALLQIDSPTVFQVVLFGVVCVWAIRLASRIYFKNKGKEEDFRYKAWREEWGKTFVLRSFLQIYMLQGLVIAVVASPVLLSFVYPNAVPQTFVFVAGIALWIVGFLFESIADHQLDTFLRNPQNKGSIMQRGLWHYSRHPNYFGESMMWFGIAFCGASLSAVPIVGFISPLLITFLLLKVSGVPMLEKRWEGNTQWEEYKKKTSVFVPFFPKK